MDVDSATQAPAKHPLPEIEIFCYLVLLIFLIDQKKYDEVMYITHIYQGFPHFAKIVILTPENLVDIFRLRLVLQQALPD